MSTFTTFIQHSFINPCHRNQRRKRNKRNPNWKSKFEKEKAKLPLFADDTTQYVENSKDTTRKLLCRVCVCVCVCRWCVLLYLTLCDPRHCSPRDPSVHGIFQARILKELSFLTLGDQPDPGIEPRSPALVGRFFTTIPPGKPRKLPELINEFGKFAGQKTIYRNMLHFYTLTMKNHKEKIRKQFYLSLHQKETNT